MSRFRTSTCAYAKKNRAMFMTALAVYLRWDRRPLLWICALALAMRLATLAFPPPVEHDVDFYRSIAANVLAGRGYSLDGKPETQWMPLTVGLHIVAQLTGPSPRLARLLWALLSTATVAVAYGLALQRFGPRVAVAFGIAMVLYPFNLVYGMSASTEVPNLLLLMLTAWLVVRRTHPFRIGLCFGTACLCRAADLGFLPLMLAWTAAGRNRSATQAPPPSRFLSFRCAAFFLAGFLAFTAPWALRCSLIEKTFVPLSAGVLREVWNGINPWYRVWMGAAPAPPRKAAPGGVATGSSSAGQAAGQTKDYGARLRQFITDKPREFLSMMAYKTWRFWSPPLWTTRAEGSPMGARKSAGIPASAIAPGILYLTVLAAALLAIAWAVRRGQWHDIQPIVAWMAFGFAANVWFGAVVRYRYACGEEVCMLLLVSWWIASARRGEE